MVFYVTFSYEKVVINATPLLMEREFYFNLSLWKDKKDRKPLVLRGARQVGKTFGVKSWGSTAFNKVHYLNFEKDKNLSQIFESQLEPAVILKKIKTYLNVEIDEHKDLLFFDEVQLCGKALNSLKYFYEDRPHLAIVAAGSLLGLVLNSEPFPVGKVEFLDVYPLTFKEFLKAQNLSTILEESIHSELFHERLVEKLKHYIITGGCPEIVAKYVEMQPESAEQFEEIRKKQEDLINSYLADMAKHCGKLNAMSLERFWRNIPEQLAKENKTLSRFVFKDVLPKKNKYSQMADVIDWLETAGLIYRIQIANQGLSPLSAYTKESFFKLYLFDVGILNALSGLSPVEILNYNFGTFKGYMLENFALEQMVFLFGKKIFSWAEGTSEIDFVKELHGENVPIEIKAGINLKAKSMNQFISKYKSKCAFRFSMVIRSELSGSTKIKDYPIYLVGEKTIWKSS